MSRVLCHDLEGFSRETFRLFTFEIDRLASAVGDRMIASMDSIFRHALSGICIDG